MKKRSRRPSRSDPDLQELESLPGPDPGKSSLGIGYFYTEGDDLWSMRDAELIELGMRETESIGLISTEDVEEGCVVRVPKKYPFYGAEYCSYLATVREFVDGLDSCQTIGRNWLHRYNDQDPPSCFFS